ncbi:MAG: sugar transferase [candidate division Zixibacteria bacterium]|nr:sugar transferase [candidate division Zixibacteria bacterium]
MSENNQKLSASDQSSYALSSVEVYYGVAQPISVADAPAVPSRRLGFLRDLKFLLGEFVGLLFIALSTAYIFVMPASLARRGQLGIMMTNAIKRALDLFGSTVGLVLAAPIMLIVAMLIKLDSKGPVLYSQVRVGENRRRRDRRYGQWTGSAERRNRDRRREDLYGRPFRIWKFRTMVQDAEKKSGPVWATKNDPRITRLGYFLRKTRLDEIPQFWSVLKGDMSLVGPRPERPTFVRDLSEKVEGYRKRLDVKPGLTGLAQVEHGYDESLASVARKVQYDLRYIQERSLWTDIKILLKTVIVVVTGRGAN